MRERPAVAGALHDAGLPDGLPGLQVLEGDRGRALDLSAELDGVAVRRQLRHVEVDQLEVGRDRRDRLVEELHVHPVVAERQAGLLVRSEEHTSELQSRQYLGWRLLLEKKKN